jgi:hypothetical protein
MHCPRPRVPTSIAVVAALSVLAAGCGSGSARTAAATTTHNQALAYSRCMHTHGVPNFPDPNGSGQISKQQIVALGPGSPQFRAADRACRRLWPYRSPGQSAAQRQPPAAVLLAFARCLRSHGFPNVPDPNRTGQLTPEMLAQAGINLHQPAVLQAADACVSVTRGYLTRADVARAVNDATGPGQ